MTAAEFPLLRIELVHTMLLLLIFVLMVPMRILEGGALLLGGLFMGLNFFLLGFGLRRLLRSFAEKGKIRTGILLLLLKLGLFLALVSVLFSNVQLDAASFAVGVTSLLAAVCLERLGACVWIGW
ncbi:MAG: hypothetical protein ACE5HC_00630 [Candidatus Binatia bacterium]